MIWKLGKVEGGVKTLSFSGLLEREGGKGNVKVGGMGESDREGTRQGWGVVKKT